jgi:hypothetical protein
MPVTASAQASLALSRVDIGALFPNQHSSLARNLLGIATG